MRLPRICKVCGNHFTAIKTTQFYCQRKCFKRANYIKTKGQLKEIRNNYPVKRCGFCQEVSRLNFDPVHSPEKFNAWGCPHCGATNMLMWEYRNNPGSYQIISSILMQIQMNSGSMFSTSYHETYHLPVVGLEQGNQSIVTMPCEVPSIVDIQKKDRKKILFS